MSSPHRLLSSLKPQGAEVKISIWAAYAVAVRFSMIAALLLEIPLCLPAVQTTIVGVATRDVDDSSGRKLPCCVLDA